MSRREHMGARAPGDAATAHARGRRVPAADSVAVSRGVGLHGRDPRAGALVAPRAGGAAVGAARLASGASVAVDSSAVLADADRVGVGSVEARGAACGGGTGDDGACAGGVCVTPGPLVGCVERSCPICGASSCHPVDFAVLTVSSWWDGTRQRPARSVLVCTRCLAGDLPPMGSARIVAAGVSALLGGGL